MSELTVEIAASLKNLRTYATAAESRYATKKTVTDAVNAKLSSTYKAGGSVAFADLPELTEANLGLVVNVTDAFTATDDFVEGAGGQHPAGTNVVVVQSGETYKYDVLAGFVDLSGYQPKEDGKGLSSNDYTTEDKDKLSGVAEGATKVEASETAGHIKINGVDTAVVQMATNEEVNAMLAEVFGENSESGVTEWERSGQTAPLTGQRGVDQKIKREGRGQTVWHTDP